MRIQSVSPLEVGGFAWRPRFGGHAFTVVVKATYQLRPGEAVLAEEQDPILEVDRHFEDDPASSVYAPSDLVPFREHAEVTLVGDAIAPSPVGSRALVARLAVGSVDKKVVVFGDRWLDADGRVRKGEPFRKIPLRYELAAASPDNPVGVEDDSVDDAGTRPLPNLEPFGTRGPDTQPAGFGPIGPAWAPRRRLLGAAELDETHWREHPIPEDVQGSYWNAAPRDQRLAELTEDTTIHLEHLHPHLPRLSTRLPGVKPRAFVERSGGAREIFLTADALWIDMTRGVCTLTWRGTFDIDAPEVEGLVAVAMEQPGERLCWPDVAALLDTTTSEVPSRRDSAPPPRASEPRPAAAPELLPESEPEPITAYPILDRAVGDDADAEDTMVLRQRKHAPSLPFLRETASAAPSLPPPTRPGSAPPPPPSRSPASPWARGASRLASQRVSPPPSPPRAVSPPPLMLVDAIAPAPIVAEPRPAAEALDHGPLPRDRRLELVAASADEAALEARWPEHCAPSDDEQEDDFEAGLRRAFGTAPRKQADVAGDVSRIMTRASADDHATLRALVAAATDDDGRYRAPLVLAHGELRLRFDEEKTLEATLAAVTPYLPDHPPLAKEVTTLRKLQRQGAVEGAPEVAQELTERLLDACRREADVDLDRVRSRVERSLLLGRCYQRRRLLGARVIVAVLEQGERHLLCYLPEATGEALPLYASFTARVLGELHPRQDPYETCTDALRATAIGRVVRREEM